MKDFRAYALRLISIRQRSEYELRRRLKEKGASQVDIEEIVEYLKNIGLLDDLDFACEFARSKTVRHWSWYRIQQTLKFEFKIADEIVEKAKSCYDESKVINYYVGKFKNKRKDPNYVKKYLYSKGFSKEFIDTVIDSLSNQG